MFLSPLALRLRDRTVPISFWSWVVNNPEVLLIITEGAKKAAALISLGYAAIASPSIETGVSIECERTDKPHSEVSLAFGLLLQGVKTDLGKIKQVSHFDSVWAIAQGVQTADSIRQALARIRANVPRYLWAAKRGFYKCMVSNGATVKKALIASTKNKASTNIRFLQAADASLSDLDLDTNFQPESLNTWAKRGCYINLTMQNYCSSIVDGLMREGHLVTAPNVPEAENLNLTTEVETQIKQVVQTKYQAECSKVADAPIPTDSEYQKLKDKRAKTKEQRWIERKGNLVRRYGDNVSITPELVAKDDEGWYSQLLSHYYLTVGRPYLIERDSKQLRAIACHTKNRLWLPDFNRSLLSTSLRLLETLIIDLLKPGIQQHDCTSCAESKAFPVRRTDCADALQSSVRHKLVGFPDKMRTCVPHVQY